MSTEEKFNAAVNVIKSLPKNGPYQPSYDMMLKFYAYYKQATLGPCPGSRPGFWDVVGRAKYDAWKALGDLPKTKAMANYVDELHKIVETMSYTENVANFMLMPNNEETQVKYSDLELIAGDIIEKVRSRSNSPTGSPDSSPNRIIQMNDTHSSTGASLDDTDHSDEEYIDSVEVRFFDPIEVAEPRKLAMNRSIYTKEQQQMEHMNGYIPQQHKRNATTNRNNNTTSNVVDISPEILTTIQNIKRDVDTLTNKMNALDMKYNNRSLDDRKRFRINFKNVSREFMIFIIVWPLVANFFINKFIRSK